MPSWRQFGDFINLCYLQHISTSELLKKLRYSIYITGRISANSVSLRLYITLHNPHFGWILDYGWYVWKCQQETTYPPLLSRLAFYKVSLQVPKRGATLSDGGSCWYTRVGYRKTCIRRGAASVYVREFYIPLAGARILLAVVAPLQGIWRTIIF